MKTIETVAAELLATVKTKYPELEEFDRTHDPEDKEHIWIRVYAPFDDDKFMELHHYSSELETDILLDYNYAISIMPYQTKWHYA
jgi:hypothetical protein